MTIDTFLKDATKRLVSANIESARLDCLILLEDTTHKDRAWLLAHPEFMLADPQLDQLNTKVDRRVRQEPLAYIRGKVAFYGREFYVDDHVLIPRPETESFIDLLKSSKLNTNSTHILDLGTGSGCLGITCALEFPHTVVTLSDIDKNTLMIAQKNADLLGAKATFIESNLLHNIPGTSTVIVTNLPYVPNNYPVNTPTMFEPKLALYAGEDGMDLYREFWQELRSSAKKPATILTEALTEQHNTQMQLAALAGYKLLDTDGLVQAFSFHTS